MDMNNTESLIATVSRFIRSNDHYLIVCHRNPDGDAIGSMIGLYLGLRSLGKHVKMYCCDPVPIQYKQMNATDQVITGEILPPFSHLIALDCAASDRMGNTALVKQSENAINIDHHASNPGYGRYAWIEDKASATGELIFELLREMDVPLSREICESLLVAISTDTGHFMHSNTTERAMRICSDLVAAGADIHNISTMLYRCRSLKKTRLIGTVLESLEMHCNGKVALIKLTQEELNRCDATSADCEGLIDFAAEIEGVEFAVFVREENNGTSKASFRTTGIVNAVEFARTYGGGGHPQAAGATIYLPFSNAYEQICNDVAQLF